MDVLGNAAAGTLGFIAGDVPGAVAAISGYNAYKKLTQNTMNGRKRKATSQGRSKKGAGYKKASSKAGSGRKVSIAAKYKKSKGMLPALNQDGRVVTHIKVKDSLKNKTTFKKKVNPKLRKAIKQVVAENQVRGYYRQYFLGGKHLLYNNAGYSWPERTKSTQQWVFALPLGIDPGLSPEVYRNGDAITRMGLLHAASRLFNGKGQDTFPGSIFGWQDTNNITNPNQFPNLAFGNASALKIDVLSSQCHIEIKNNSLQVYNLEMYVCKPKMKRRASFNYANRATCTATADWQDEVAQLSNSVVRNVGFATADTLATYGQIANGPGDFTVQINSLGLSPESFSTWKSLWAFEKYVIRIEPGQVHKHTIYGDSCTVDFSKDYKDSQFQLLTKFERQVFFVAKPDLTSGALLTNGFVGRNAVLAQTTASLQKPLCFEVQTIYKFAMPEPTGFRQDFSEAGTFNKLLNNRVYRQAIDYYGDDSNLTATTVTQQVDDNAPGEVVMDG